MSEANAERGEISLTLDGRDWVLRPSFTAIQQFETETGKGLLVLADSVATLKLAELAAIVAACIRAGGEASSNAVAKSVKTERIAELMIEAPGGLMLVARVLRVLLFGAATGGYNAKGEPRAAAQNAPDSQDTPGAAMTAPPPFAAA